jgi:hypothetical protein
MPLTTSSTTSSASGRASSSGYESMSNTVLEEMIASIPTMSTNENNSLKLRNRSIRKGMNNQLGFQFLKTSENRLIFR